MAGPEPGERPLTRREALFASPLVMSLPPSDPAWRAELAGRLVAEARAGGGLRRSNVGGWHSEDDLLDRPEPCFQALRGLFLEGFREALRLQAEERGVEVDPSLSIQATAWAMVMEDGHYSTPHHHGDAHWASVFYVDVGDQGPEIPAPAGFLSFLDPRGPLKGEDPMRLFQTRQDLRPKDGLLLFFPGWLVHHVHPYRGRRPRVSVSCNLVLG